MRYFIWFALAAVLTSCNLDFSNGTRIGVVRKLSLKGFFCKSWEGEASINPESARPEIWEFSVERPEVVDDISQAMKEGRKVELKYAQRKFRSFCTIDTEYIVTGVK